MGIANLIKSRLGGEFYRKLKNLGKAQKIIASTPPPFSDKDKWGYYFIKGYVDVSVRFMRLAYIFGGNRVRQSKMCYLPEDYVINELKKKFPSPSGTLYLGDFKIPDPSEDAISKHLFEMEFNDLFVSYFIDNSSVLSLITWEGPYESGSVELKEGDVVIDCGANMGYFSAVASAKKCSVYAFEPISVVVEKYLSKTIALNSNITICNYALSDFEGTLEFAPGNDLLNMGAYSAYSDDMKNKNDVITLPCTTIDTFVDNFKLEKLDFIKADIEGAERYMLRGAVNTMKRFAPKLSICTYHLPDDPEVIRSIITQANPAYVIEEKYQKLYAYVQK